MKKVKGFSAVGVVIAVLVVALLGVATYKVIDGNNNSVKWDSYDFNSVIEATADNGNIGDHIKGDEEAPVKIYEYADFQCPGCASVNPRVKKVIEKLDGKLAVVYRSYILSYHQNGTAAAAAAEAAGLQGYWEEYGDLLFEKQSEWGSASGNERTALFEKYFDEVTDEKGDKEKFAADLASENVKKKIEFDMAVGQRVDVQATPAFYIDGQNITWGEAGSVEINGKTISWDSARSGDDFTKLFEDIVNAKLEK